MSLIQERMTRGGLGFSVADFVTLVAAALLLVAFFMPWITWADTTYSAMSIASDKPAEDYPYDVAPLALIPIVAIVAGALALLNLTDPRLRDRTINLILVAGVIGLIPFVAFFIENNGAEVDATGQLGIGFWLALLMTIWVILQAFVPRPEFDPDLIRETDVFTTGPLRILVAFIVPLVTFVVMRWSFIFMRDRDANKFIVGLVAIVVGVGGVWLLFLVTNYMINQMPEEAALRVRPYMFVGPAMVILLVYLIYPIFNTFYLSLLDSHSENFVGLKNYVTIFTEDTMLVTLRNNALWIVLVTSSTVAFGLLIAVLVDRIGRWEPLAKSLIFLPMAISAVGAGVIWRFMYYVRAEGETQVGFLNAIYTSLGGDPINFLDTKSINNFALIVIMTWMVTGYCMVIISAAIKGVPTEILEAARIDGANEIQAFFRVTVPYIRPTLVTVATTVLIWVLKVFDIVYVMTGGRRDTQVIANQMYTELFSGGSVGLGSALAIILLLAVTPIIISNLRELRLRRRR